LNLEYLPDIAGAVSPSTRSIHREPARDRVTVWL